MNSILHPALHEIFRQATHGEMITTASLTTASSSGATSE